jgi:hypothetical protein
MPALCTVCLHVDRASIDRRLAGDERNLSALSRSLGIGRKALERHRARHIAKPLELSDVGAAAEEPSPLVVELARRYVNILESLAAAERATLSYADRRGGGVMLSHVGIAGLLASVREQVGSLTQVVVDAYASGLLAEENREEDARIATALNRLAERSLSLTTNADTEHD